MDEHQLIQMLRPLAALEAENFTNDAAALSIPEGHELIVTTDTLIAGVHFIGDEPPALIAQKALRTNLSDLAAMGATPHRYSLALSLPKGTDAPWCEAFVSGLTTDQSHYGITLLGGDTTATNGPLTITITAMGLVQKGTALSRNGAQAGDGIYVTGSLGDATMGLKLARRCKEHSDTETASLSAPCDDEYCLNRYHLPQPRIEIIHLLHQCANAAMDISDGLALDLHRLCHAAKVGATIEAAAIPTAHNLDMALHGGDDYELLFTAPDSQHETIMDAAKNLPFSVTKIGHITAEEKKLTLQKDGRKEPLKPQGYSHQWQ